MSWEDELHHVRLEIGPRAIFTKVFIDNQEWRASVKRVSVDIDEDKHTIVTMSFYAKVTVEGDVRLSPWPIEVQSAALDEKGAGEG